VSLINDETKFAGSMQREFANRANTTANNLQLLKNGLAEVGMNLGSVLLPPLNALVNVLRTATTQMAVFAEAHPILTKLIMGVTTALIGGKIAAIALGYAWTFIQGGALALATAWRGLLITITLVKAGFIGVNSASLITAIRMGALAFGGALQALGASFMALASRVFPAVIAGFRALTVAMMSNPIGAIVGGIAIAATLVITNWESVKSFFMTIWEPIKPVWEAFGDWLGKFWEKIKTPFKAVGGLWDKLWGKKDAPELSIPEMQPVGDALKTPLSVTPKTVENKTQNNSYNINVQASPNQNSKEVADEVMRRLKAQSRGALYDPVGALP
jgi:phage-related tail protein